MVAEQREFFTTKAVQILQLVVNMTNLHEIMYAQFRVKKGL